MAVSSEVQLDAGRTFITSHGTTDLKDQNNILTLTAEGSIKGILAASGTVDVSSLADGAGESHDMTVNGVALGDIVLGTSVGVDNVDVIVNAAVTAANTVTIRFQNESGSAHNLAPTTVRVIVADMT